MRFVTREDEKRRAFAQVALVFAAMALFGVVMGMVAWMDKAGHPPLREMMEPPCVFFVVLPFFLASLAAYLWFRPRNYYEIDEPPTTVTVVKRGAVKRQLPLAEIGPLEASTEQRHVGSGKSRRLATFYGARSRPFWDLLLRESENELDARVALEKYAKLWNLPCISLTGETRLPEELDIPLYLKLRGDTSVTTPSTPPPGLTISINRIDDGYELSSSYRPFSRFATAIALLILPAFVGIVSGIPFDILRDFVKGEATGVDTIFGLVCIAAFVPGAVAMAIAIKNHIAPPRIRITARELAFGRRSMPLESIEEIAGEPPRLISDERILKIDAEFCPSNENRYLSHELKRLIVEMGIQRTINELR